MRQADLVSLLRDALVLWDVGGRVGAGADGVIVSPDGGDPLTIVRAEPPMRWRLAAPRRTRGVPGITALLEAVRSALGVTPGVRARIGDGAGLASGSPAAGPRGAAIPGTLVAGTPVPVTLVTGFLGSGKTTLVSRLLRSPALARTAVIVNEFGEIGLDHDLIERGDETLLELTTGCLCCAVQTSIARTLLDLDRRRAAGEIGFDRVLVETSGLADPPPLLHALMSDDAVGARFAIGSVVTLVDALFGETTLRDHAEARRQAGVADLLVISKTDIAPAAESLRTALRAINPAADMVTAIDDPEALFVALPPRDRPDAAARHTPGLGSVTIERERPIPALALTLFVQALATHCGGRLLRLKGLVELEEMPGRPAVLHGVQHLFSPPVLLAAWPSDDRRTRMVLIGQELPRYFAARLLDAVVDDVLDERRSSRALA